MNFTSAVSLYIVTPYASMLNAHEIVALPHKYGNEQIIKQPQANSLYFPQQLHLISQLFLNITVTPWFEGLNRYLNA